MNFRFRCQGHYKALVLSVAAQLIEMCVCQVGIGVTRHAMRKTLIPNKQLHKLSYLSFRISLKYSASCCLVRSTSTIFFSQEVNEIDQSLAHFLVRLGSREAAQLIYEVGARGITVKPFVFSRPSNPPSVQVKAYVFVLRGTAFEVWGAILQVFVKSLLRISYVCHTLQLCSRF